MIDVSDGYGDGIEQAILARERLIAIQAAERGARGPEWDDLLQEARIAIWRVLETRPGTSGAYINASAGKRITEVLTRGVWFGMEGHRGRPIDPIRRKQRDSLDDPDLAFEASSPDVIDSVMLAYHEGEILAALEALPPRHRAYVVLRFWGGLTHAEMADELGVKPGNMSRMWSESIRPVLLERLGHLGEEG